MTVRAAGLGVPKPFACSDTMEDGMPREIKMDGAWGKRRRERRPDPAGFDYNAAAELFLARTKSTSSRPKYKRFDTVAEGLRFILEDLPTAVCLGA